MPFYLLWLIYFHLTAENGKFSGLYFSLTFFGWFAYTFLMQFYTVEIASILYNYWMQLIEQDLILKETERIENEGDILKEIEVPEEEFTNSDDAFIDEWIF